MEYIFALLPYFTIGIVAAFISRFTGIAISFLLVPTLLYWGATPVEVVSFMLTFTLYNTFTLETQDVRLDFKDLTFFWIKSCISPSIHRFIYFLLYFGIRCCLIQTYSASRATYTEANWHFLITIRRLDYRGRLGIPSYS